MTLDEFRKATENLPGHLEMLRCPPEYRSDEYFSANYTGLSYIVQGICEIPIDDKDELLEICRGMLSDKDETSDEEIMDMMEEVIVV